MSVCGQYAQQFCTNFYYPQMTYFLVMVIPVLEPSYLEYKMIGKILYRSTSVEEM